jgi:hypothetical protein
VLTHDPTSAQSWRRGDKTCKFAEDVSPDVIENRTSLHQILATQARFTAIQPYNTTVLQLNNEFQHQALELNMLIVVRGFDGIATSIFKDA